MTHLPAHQHGADCGCYRPDNGQPLVRRTPPVEYVPEAYPTGPQIVHQHVHQAPPDRTVQRLALGSGMGGGAVAAGVYFGPLLVGALSAMAITLAITAVCLAVAGWVVVTVVRAVGGPDGQAAAKTLRRGRKG